jgi:hypothetical protein
MIFAFLLSWPKLQRRSQKFGEGGAEVPGTEPLPSRLLPWAAIPWGSRGPDPPLSGSVGVHMHVDPPTFWIQAKSFPGSF